MLTDVAKFPGHATMLVIASPYTFLMPISIVFSDAAKQIRFANPTIGIAQEKSVKENRRQLIFCQDSGEFRDICIGF